MSYELKNFMDICDVFQKEKTMTIIAKNLILIY